MPGYDFRSLSSLDFEYVVRDALQAELGLFLESFKAGTDQGIDLRHAPAADATLIVQCKHFVESGFKKLLHHISEDEAPKIERLRPKRYVLATSVPLSPHNKDQLLQALGPHCRTSGDIFGRDDLNNILGRHPEVEKANHKLWLTSAAVLDAVLHAEIYNATEMALEAIYTKLKLYVQNRSFDEARELLEQMHVCIVSGIPGIGKTMLAEMLLVSYVAAGYQAVKVSADIEEAITVSRVSSKQIFYYDDFLGRISLGDNLNKNEDERLLTFMERCRKTRTHRFLLTTREYILNQARQRYERLETAPIDVMKCVLDVGQYTRRNRAQILYNHLYFSDSLGHAELSSILANKTYVKIIDHRNFSPRIIEWMTTLLDPKKIEGDFGSAFLANLDNPNRLWYHAFEHQISLGARILLLVMSTMPPEVSLEDLKEAHASYLEQNTSLPLSRSDVEQALRELDGNFVATKHVDSTIVISLHNPSIADFLREYVWSRPALRAQLLESAKFFDQVEELGGVRSVSVLTDVQKEKARRVDTALAQAAVATFASRTCRIVSYSGTLLHVYSPKERRLAELIEYAGTCELPQLQDAADSLFRRLVDEARQSPTDLVSLIPQAKRYPFVKRAAERFLQALADRFRLGAGSIDGFVGLVTIVDSYPELLAKEDIDRVRSDFEHFYPADAERAISEEGDPDSLGTYIRKLERVGEALDVDVTEAVAAAEEEVDRMEREYEPEKRTEAPQHSTAPELVSDAEIENMFSGLDDAKARATR